MDGSRIIIAHEVIDHILGKHPQMLSVGGLTKMALISSMTQALKRPTEVFLDNRGSRHFVLRIGELYLNVVEVDGQVKTAYLMGNRSYVRMRKARWLRRLY